jgi:hypothetical protein
LNLTLLLACIAASYLQSSQSQGDINGNIDDDELMQNHNKVNNSNEQVHSSEIGGAAALSALKNMLGGSGGGGAQSGSGFQNQIIGKAMAEASAMYDSKANAGVATGDKQDAVQSAGKKAMELMLKYKMNGMIGGGGSSGLSSLLSMAM